MRLLFHLVHTEILLHRRIINLSTSALRLRDSSSHSRVFLSFTMGRGRWPPHFGGASLLSGLLLQLIHAIQHLNF